MNNKIYKRRHYTIKSLKNNKNLNCLTKYGVSSVSTFRKDPTLVSKFLLLERNIRRDDNENFNTED
jgi:hypothetical protein